MEQIPQGPTGNLIAFRHLKKSYQTEMKLAWSSALPADPLLDELWAAEMAASWAVSFSNAFCCSGGINPPISDAHLESRQAALVMPRAGAPLLPWSRDFSRSAWVSLTVPAVTFDRWEARWPLQPRISLTLPQVHIVPEGQSWQQCYICICS